MQVVVGKKRGIYSTCCDVDIVTAGMDRSVSGTRIGTCSASGWIDMKKLKKVLIILMWVSIVVLSGYSLDFLNCFFHVVIRKTSWIEKIVSG